MTAPFQFVDGSGAPPAPTSVPLAGPSPEAAPPPTPIFARGYPDPIIKIDQETKDKFLLWLDQWLQELIANQTKNQDRWAQWEKSYRGEPPDELTFEPFKGACRDVIPAIAMAVDPIHARLDTGIFKQDPVFTVKPLRKDFAKYVDALSRWINYYQRHRLELRSVASPRTLEMTKLGTCVLKTIYDRESNRVVTYDENFNVVERNEVTYSGPRVRGVSLGDFLFPPNYQHTQDCPIVAERQRTTLDKLRVLEYQKKIANVDAIKNQERMADRTPLEKAREDAVKHTPSSWINEIIVYEVWCDYDINGDGLPERIVATYHYDTRTLLQLRYNWYFHQRKPYTVIPYTVSNESLLGNGIAEMTYPFQLALTRFHRMASDNAYIANIRMFIAKKNSGIENVPRIYSGRTFFVDDPTKDFIPFSAGDIYPSTLMERQNLFGMVEKRTGVSDYLVGRESPIIGSRATATSTLALIREGTQRVEQVLENLRGGFAEIILNCLDIWIQYGTDGLEDLVLSPEDALLLKQFFSEVTRDNVRSVVGIDLSATDAQNNKVAMQQMQLAIIQIMMQYLEKVLQAGQAALQMLSVGQQEAAAMIAEVMRSARNMFRDLLSRYDVPNPEEYLPDLEKYLVSAIQSGGAATAEPGAGAGVGGGPGGPESVQGLPVGYGPARNPPVPRPSAPGGGGSGRILEDLARASAGV